MILTSTFTAALKFAAHASSERDIRYYLNGVLFEFEGSTLHLVGTDGTRLAFAGLHLDPPPAYDAQFVVDTASVKELLATFSRSTLEVNFRIDLPVAPSKVPTLVVEGFDKELAAVSISPKVIEGTFPTWRRVVPPKSRPNGPMPAGLSSIYLATACTAIQKMAAGKLNRGVAVSADGESMVVVRPIDAIDPRVIDCAVVLMPLKATQ